MSTRLSGFRGWGYLSYGPIPILAGVVLAFAVVQYCWPLLEWGQKYSDLVVGNITWDDADKGRDFRAVALFLGSLCAFSLGISVLFRWVGPDGPESDVGQGLTRLLLFALVPAIWWFGRSASSPEFHQLSRRMVALVAVALLAVAALSRYRGQLTGRLVLEMGGAVLLLVILSFFGGLGVATLLGRAFPALLNPLLPYASWFAYLPPCAAIGVAALLYCFAKDAETLRVLLCRWLVVVQIPLPFLFCVLIPAPITEGDVLYRPDCKITLPFAIAGLILAAWMRLAFRLRAWNEEGSNGTTNLTGVLSSLALCAIPVFLLLPGGMHPGYGGNDHFHIGEQLLPWQQLFEWKQLPYADFIPIHGLMPLLRGLFGKVFFDGTIACYWSTEAMMLALWAVVTFLTLRPVVGPVPALLVGLCSPPANRVFFLAPGLLLLAHPRLLSHPARWLLVWSILVPLEVLYNGGVGPAFALGTAPVAVWMAWRLLRENRGAFLRLTVFLGAVALAVYLYQPTRVMLGGLVEFLAENSATNDIAHGIVWSNSFSVKPAAGFASMYFLWEAMRFAWVFVAACAGMLFFRELARPREERNNQVLLLAAMIVPTMILCIPWGLGRIDAGAHWRMGSVSIIGVVFLLPALMMAGQRSSPGLLQTALLVLGLSVIDMGSGMVPLNWGSPNRAFTDDLTAKPFPIITLAANTRIDGAAHGLPKLGRLMIKPEDLAELSELKIILDGWLQPGETFFDLTNSSAYYYYLNLPVPSLYSSNYVSCNSTMQKRMLDKVEENPPPVVLIAPAISHDGGPASLRSYLLYRAYATRYVPIKKGRFTFLVDPARIPEAAGQDQLTRIKQLNEVFRQGELRSIAAAWGRSWSTLANRFQVVADLSEQELPASTPTSEYKPGAGPLKGYQLANLGLTGKDADYLKIDLTYERIKDQPIPVLEIAWESSDHTIFDKTVLNAADTCLVIPLGAYPSWLLNEHLGTIQLRLVNPETCRSFSIEKVKLLRRD